MASYQWEFTIYNNNLSGCYDINLLSMCTNNHNHTLSDGNNFDAAWEDFCDTGAGNCSISNCGNHSENNCHIDDWTALKAIYESTDGDNWQNNSGWQIVTATVPNANCNLSTLAGVQMDACNRVSELNLQKNWLNGSIPSELGNLSNLNRLNLQMNTFTNVPPELGNLTNLTHLNLESCGLASSIPNSLGNLSNLIYLSLANNQLSGFIPFELGNLSNLTWLYLHNNELTGDIPAEFGHASGLKTLYTDDNNLSGCYDRDLQNLCTQLTKNWDPHISDGNNFRASWGNFCTNSDGACQPCTSSLTITASTTFQNEYKSGNSITTIGNVIIDSLQQVKYKSERVTLNSGFSVKNNARFKAGYGGCNW